MDVSQLASNELACHWNIGKNITATQSSSGIMGLAMGLGQNFC
jgi:hypothetical protein